MTQDSAMDAPQPAPEKGLLSPERRARFLLVSSAALGYILFWYAGVLFQIPAERDHSVSLLQQPYPVLGLVEVTIAMVAAALVGTAVGGTVRFDAGLFAAGVGLVALSARGGPSREALFSAAQFNWTGPGVYRILLLEVVVLFIPIAAVWLGIWRLRDVGWLKDRGRAEPGKADSPARKTFKPYAIIVQTGVTIVFILLLCPTDAKIQAVAGVGLAAYLGAAVTEYVYDDAELGRWYWLAPLLAAVLGYAVTSAAPGGWRTGNPTASFLTPLARALPLDYAGAGVAGALLGHWAGKGLVRTIVEVTVGIVQLVTGGPKESGKKS